MATITGSNADDTLTGTAGNDLLLGLDGNDEFIASAGNDTLDGGSWWFGLGHNLVSYAAQTAAVVADLSKALATVGPGKTDVLLSITGLRGGAGDDQLTGDLRANLIDGGAGNDVLRGDAGDDVLLPWTGNNTVDGGKGDDTLRLLPWDGPVLVDLARGSMSLGGWVSVVSGIEAVESGAGNDTLIGDDGGHGSYDYSGNLLNAGAGNNQLRGGAKRDTLIAGAGNDMLQGGAGDDSLSGGDGNDTLDGGADNDTVSYAFAAGGPGVRVDLAAGAASGTGGGNDILISIERVIGTGGPDRIEGSGGNDILESGGAATLIGGAGDDYLAGGIFLDGGDGDDTLAAPTANAQLFGGMGDDRLFMLQDLDLPVTLDGGAGDDIFFVSTEALRRGVYDGGAGIDALQLGDEPSEAAITISLAAGRYSFSGRYGGPGGEGQLQVRSIEALYDSKGWSTTFIGDDGDNILRGDTVFGGGGNDTLSGGVADYGDVTLPIQVFMSGLDGPVLIQLAGQTDSVSTFNLALGAGDDVMQGPRQLSGRWAFNEVLGRGGNDVLRGQILNGGAGDDTLEGGTVLYRDAPGPVNASLALRLASGADGNDVFVDVRALIGSAYADTLDGSDGNDLIVGGSGGALIRGGAGADTLGGAGGNDTLLGGTGNDVFGFSPGSQQIDGGAGFDRLGDGRLYGAGAGFLKSDGAQMIDLRAGSMTLTFEPGVSFTSRVSGIELVDVTSYGLNFQLVGLDGPADRLGEWFLLTGSYGSAGTRSVDGGTGVDTVVLDAAYGPFIRAASYLVEAVPNQPGNLRVGYRPQEGQVPEDELRLQAIERIQFSDSVLAFGDRALDVAKVAFALWSPAIAPSSTLFGKGVDWYDQGHSYRALIDFALTYYSGLSDTQLAQTLMTNVKSTRSQNEVLSLITQQGRAAATQLFADDTANMVQIELAGLKSNGIACALAFGSESLFVVPG